MSNQLSAVRPIDIVPSMLVSTDVPEDDYPVYDSGTPYAAGERVIEDHMIWQSLIDDNEGHDPATSPNQWVQVEATNRWRVFDRVIGTQTKQANKMTYRLKPGVSFSTLAVLNISNGISVRVRVYHGDTLVREVTKGVWLNVSGIGWWSWFFAERYRTTQVIFNDLPGMQAAEVEVEITGTADLAVGVILTGKQRMFGGVLRGARIGITDYSRKERDEWGNVHIVERAFARRSTFPMLLKASEVDEFQRFAAEMRATPCLFSVIGSRYDSTTIYGLLRDAEIVIAYKDYSEVDVELEGLT